MSWPDAYPRGSQRNIRAANTSATPIQPGVGARRRRESASGTPPFQALTTSAVAEPPGSILFSSARLSVPVIPT
ncbi:hypothetical protein ADK66_04855 [Micromonospora sp. NRRL B-16802]|nr:hypothetical protein ADK66_04855 [Micromonospora sp. NRRL B-16802]